MGRRKMQVIGRVPNIIYCTQREHGVIPIMAGTDPGVLEGIIPESFTMVTSLLEVSQFSLGLDANR